MDQNPVDELVCEVRDAQEKMFEAVEQIEQVIRMTGNEGLHTASWKAYWLDHVRIRISSEHGFLSSDKNLDDLIEDLQGLGANQEPDPEHFETEEAYDEARYAWENQVGGSR